MSDTADAWDAVLRTVLRVAYDLPEPASFPRLRDRYARASGIRTRSEPEGRLWVTYALGCLLHRALSALEAAGAVAVVTLPRRVRYTITEAGRRAVEGSR